MHVHMTPLEQFRVEPLFPLHLAGYNIAFTNQAAIMCVIVAVLSLFLFLAVRTGRLVPTRGQSIAELGYEFVANMIESTAGKDGLRFFPFVFAVFMFVLCSNYFGLIPGVFTVTSQIAVNFALACLVMVVVIFFGFMFHGAGFLKLFVPDAPWILLPLLIPIEIISFFFRPISLSVRLFANMLAGHTMLKVFGGFVILLGAAGGILSLVAVGPMFMIIAIMALEFLVAFLQAYVFAMLTCIYLNESLHLHGHH